MSLINDAEDFEQSRHSHHHHHHHHHHSSQKKKFLDPNEKDDRHHRHHHHRHHHHDEKKAWKRPMEDEEASVTPKKQIRTDDEEKEPEVAEPSVETSKNDELISEENLLELRKQLIRAELADDDVRLIFFLYRISQSDCFFF